MIKLIFQCITMQGERRIMIHSNRRTLIQYCQTHNILLLKSEIKGILFTSHFAAEDRIFFTQQLALLLKSGTPINQGLALLADDHPKPQWQDLIHKLIHQIELGSRLSEALSLYPKAFNSLYCNLVSLGEQTSTLSEVLTSIAEQMEQQLIVKKRVIKATRYPLFLLLMTFMVLLGLLYFVLPQFSGIYENFEAQLPWITQQLLTFSHYLQHSFLSLSFSVIITLVSLYLIKKRFPYPFEFISLHLPGIKRILHFSQLNHIFKILSLTQQYGIPLILAIQQLRDSLNYTLYQRSLLHIEQLIEKGESFSTALQQHHHHKLYPTLSIQLIKIGEETGSLAVTLSKLSDYYYQKNSELTEKFTQKIEPFMMLVMAGMIGTLIVAIYLPIFELGNVIH